MISDLRERPVGQAIDTDVCIVGAGAAGIAVALQFIGTRYHVCLLEAGGMQLEPAIQQLYEVHNVGHVTVAGTSSRLRMFGGTTNHWGGRCAPLDAVDFMLREWVPHSGWPITRKSLDPYYQQARDICDLSDVADPARVIETLQLPQMHLDREKLEPQIWQGSSPTRFSPKYGPTLRVLENIGVVLHAAAVHIGLNENGNLAQQIEVSTPEGIRHSVRARYFVLACGGIENARLLLLSDRIQKAGIGNQNDLVGRFFQGHLRIAEPLVMEGDPYSVSRIYSYYENTAGRYLIGVRLSDRLQASRHLLNGAAFSYRDGDGNPDSGRNAVSRVARTIAEGGLPVNLGRELINISTDFSDVVLNIRQRFLRPGNRPYSHALQQLVLESEQAPSPLSRVTLDTTVDATGLRRAIIDWRITELDHLSCQQLVLTVASELSRIYKARIRIPEWLADLKQTAGNLPDVAHHIGTTRMARSDRQGVVDENCRVFGLPNLFIAGCSVFPTGGHANPTFSIVALALRLAEHLKAKLL